MFNTTMEQSKEKATEFFQMFKKGGGGATKVAGKLGGAFAKAGGVAAKGLGAAAGALSSIPVAGWIAVGVIATLTATFIALKENSALADAKRMAE
jgi:hypothetical protein